MRNFLDNIVYYEDMENVYSSRNDWNELKGSSIYISGAAGMIASYVVMFFVFLNEIYGFNIVIYAGVRDLTKAKKRFGDYVDKDYFNVILGDICDGLSDEIKVDYIIHAASLASPQYYGKLPVETILPNTIGTAKLLEYAKNIEVRGFLFFSSDTVYGTMTDVGLIDEEMVGVLDYVQTGNFYAESKRCGEVLCKAYCIEYGIPTGAIRIHHSYGPTMDIENDTRVFSEFVGNIINGKNIVMKSKGETKRAFCYMSDAISAILKVLLDGKPGEIYNMGNDLEYISISDLACKLVNLFPDKKLKVEYRERKDKDYKPGTSIKVASPDLKKIKSIGWMPTISVEEGFYKTIKAIELERNLEEEL